MNVKHIFFDLDHTLWDFETNSNRTFEYIFQRNRIEVDLADFHNVYRPINLRYWKLFREDKVTKADLRYSRLREAFDEVGVKIQDDMIHLLSEEYITYLADHNDLFENAIHVLDYLKEKYEMHIITNGFEEVQRRKLKNSNLMPFFDQIVTSEKVGVKKPHPEIFKYALEAAGADPDRSVMIGDNFEADILGAKNVGMQTIFCKFNGEIANEKVPTVEKLIELKSLL
ncbi:YjjG family noncanonical pyrimidine nucleotidase [Lutimonas zeaxanthinifaciens]|uniref:YjjG family noncanonical pyrimidine nucleotidase n=1 Tax=Lutimonas zeaxanthinifaciens TaxID=3060215 RepID=UPI00265CC70A|nr:YjjG family noncanonical pyrimidine nucleotidase [Lutimonas sp. YSD2104]WKK66775.1 YjjG family noncanonical pyrimidine nucleotidase [Lutimonas sp. YSD2104]